MSDPGDGAHVIARWSAAQVLPGRVRIWSMEGDTARGPCRDGTLEDLQGLDGTVIACGLPDAPCRVPCAPLQATLPCRLSPAIAAIPGLAQDQPCARTLGAETAIAGVLGVHPQYDGVVLVIDHQTCWAHVSAGEVVSFQTFLTPELCAALGAVIPQTDPDDAFDAALGDTLSRPDRLAQHLASARAAATGQEAAHLIGAEIAAAKPYWLGQNVEIVGGPETGAYAHALARQGVVTSSADRDAMMLSGFVRAWRSLGGGAGQLN